ncbi:MAG TPA: hypothetical protein VEA79_11410, partial [Phenylobacterium sp.]|nr:hypothetical protein [Phenylobacterium sp.]
EQDFQLQRALAVLRAGGVSRTPRLPAPASTLATAQAQRNQRLSSAAQAPGPASSATPPPVNAPRAAPAQPAPAQRAPAATPAPQR